MEKPIAKSLRILITGAAGQIAYCFLPLLCSGEVFGKDVKICLHLLDISQQAEVLQGLVYELEDCDFPLLDSIVYKSNDPKDLFKDIDVAIFLGGSPRKPGMERRDLLQVNAHIFKEQGQILNEVAGPNCKILVVANPVNTNCLILQQNCPKIPAKNFTCLSRLDLNRAKNQIVKKLGCNIEALKKIVVWGNHSLLTFPDLAYSTCNEKPLTEILNNDENDYIRQEFLKSVQKRGGEILSARKNSAVMSGAYAIRDHLKNWYLGTPKDDWDSMGVLSDGLHYGIPKGLFFSVPVKCKNFEYEIVEGLDIGDYSKEKIDLNAKELEIEKKEVIS